MKPAALRSLVLVVLATVGADALAQAQATAPSPSGRATPSDASDVDLFRPNNYDGPPLPTPRLQDGKPDLTGFWQGRRTPGVPGGNHGKDQPGFVLPYSETGKRALLYSQNHTVDPEAICINGGIPRHNSSGLPFEILHTPERFATFFNYNTHRSATIGARRPLPQGRPQSYFGTNVAYWDGDTLVIETGGLFDSSIDRIWLDENGNPTSNQTRVVERWSRPDFHQLVLEETVTDPKYYSRPITFTRTWNHAGDGRGLGEYSCNENNLEAEHLGPGAGVIGPDGTRGFGYDAPLPETPPGPEAYGL